VGAQPSLEMQTIMKPTFTPNVNDPLRSGCVLSCQTAQGNRQAISPQREGTLQRAAIDPAPLNEVPPTVYDVLRSPGQPLDRETRQFMEPRFGHDFSRVRVHTDTRAAASARAVAARAYTVGQDVVFGAGQYAPHTGAGQRLLMHELAHTMQQVTKL